jgi:hypothetical protein
MGNSYLKVKKLLVKDATTAKKGWHCYIVVGQRHNNCEIVVGQRHNNCEIVVGQRHNNG